MKVPRRGCTPRVRVPLRLHSDPGWAGAPRQSPSIRFHAFSTRFALASQPPWEVIFLSTSISLSRGRACHKDTHFPRH